MNLDLSEEQEMMRKAARDFLNTECPKSLVREIEETESGYSPEIWHLMADLGWQGLIFPDKYGGGGGSFLDLVILLEEMGRACLPGPFFSSVILGGFAVLELGSEQQKAELLPGIASGDKLLTVAFYEPEAIDDLGLIRTKATQCEGGYLISGTKSFVPDAHIADYVICPAVTSHGKGGKGITAFLVDLKTAGIERTPLKTIGGDKQSELVFENVTVSADSILGGFGSGRSGLEKVRRKAGVAKCAEMVGSARHVLEMSLDYAKQRVQFGRPIGSFQAIQHHCANMVTDVDSSMLVTYKAASVMDRGLPGEREADIAKAWVSEAFVRVTALGQQIHGGIGYCVDHDMPLYYRRAAQAELSLGTANQHRELLARGLGL